MKDFQGGNNKWKDYGKGKFRKERRNSNRKPFGKDEYNNSNRNNKKYEEIIPIHCFDCFFTPRLKIIIPEIIDQNSKIKVKYKCPNEHTKTLEIQEFLELTQKDSFSNIKCSLCKSNNISEISFCAFHKSFKCKKCSDKQCADHILIPIENLDSACLKHTLKNNNNNNNNKNSTAPKKEIKMEKNNNIEMKKGDWICKECGILNFQRRDNCFKCGSSKNLKTQHIVLANYFCQEHLEGVCLNCANMDKQHSFKLIPNVSKEHVDKIYDMINEGRNYINSIEENFNELIKNGESSEVEKITKIFNKFKTENMNLIQLIKVCILSYKQHFFNKNLGFFAIYNLLSLGKIYPNDFTKKGTLSKLEQYLLKPYNYVISTAKDYKKKDKFRDNASFYHKDNNIKPIRENDLINVKKKDRIKTTSSVFRIYLLSKGKILVIFGKLYQFDYATIYDSKFQIIKKEIKMKDIGIDYKGNLLINSNDDFIYYYNDEGLNTIYDGLLTIFSSSDSYKRTQKLKALKADIFNEKLIIFDKELISIYIYNKTGSYTIQEKYNIIMKKPVEELKIINDNLIYINNAESLSIIDITTKEEKIITKGLGCNFISLKIIYDNVLIAYGVNSREIIMIQIDSRQIIQKYEIGDVYYCGKVDENSFLVQGKEFLYLFNFKTSWMKLTGRFEFKHDSQEKILVIPNRRFIFYKEYEYWLYVDDKLPDESYTNDFDIYSF